MSNILLIDNMDSFTYNLVDLLRIQNHTVKIFRNYISIQIITKKLSQMNNPILIFSPGPGSPHNAGNMPRLIKEFKGHIPMVGICLGHQAIIEAYGGTIQPVTHIIHGQASQIQHDNQDMFKNLPNPLSVARYHSLMCDILPHGFVVTASYQNMIMSIKNKNDRVCSFQFHPESILTKYGSILLKQTILWLKNNY
ncbi:Anthranilate synthase component 2 (plasmid) [Buchnera aphidicola (Eriosoma grossulariae)]|uniref:aminodeoxychorismate/anthranilate synthase component II n=1 Tax=Buchnera aphidicola TaxID=9 RepID=UPI0034642BE0